MNNIKDVVKEYFALKQQIKQLEMQTETLKPRIRSYYVESGIDNEQDLEIEGIFINVANALKETFDLKKARASLTTDILNLIDIPLLVKKTQFPILKVDNKPIALKKEG